MLHWYATGYVEENVLSYRNKLGTESEQTEIVMVIDHTQIKVELSSKGLKVVRPGEVFT